MVVNFRVREINLDICKLTRVSILINKKNSFTVKCIYIYIHTHLHPRDI